MLRRCTITKCMLTWTYFNTKMQRRRKHKKQVVVTLPYFLPIIHLLYKYFRPLIDSFKCLGLQFGGLISSRASWLTKKVNHIFWKKKKKSKIYEIVTNWQFFFWTLIEFPFIRKIDVGSWLFFFENFSIYFNCKGLLTPLLTIVQVSHRMNQH